MVTGASEGLGRAYALEVSKSASVHVSSILITSVKMVHFHLSPLRDFLIRPSVPVLLAPSVGQARAECCDHEQNKGNVGAGGQDNK